MSVPTPVELTEIDDGSARSGIGAAAPPGGGCCVCAGAWPPPASCCSSSPAPCSRRSSRPHDPLAVDIRHRLSPPAWMDGGTPDHLLGTDQVGRDLLSRMIYGGRVSLVVGVIAVLLSASIGVLLGLAAGYFRGNTDWTIMTGINVMLTFPFVLLALAVIAVLGPSLVNMIFVLGVAGWPIYARVVRAETLALGERDFVVAGRALGMSHLRLIFRQIAPESRVGHRGDRHPAGGPGDRPGVVPVLPGPGRAAAHAGLGQHAGRRPRSTC